MNQQWEYRVFKVEAGGFFGGVVDAQEITTFLNQRGAEGWELVSTVDTNMGNGATRDLILFLKRPCTVKYPMGN